MSGTIVDVTDDSFAVEVEQESRQRPVVVDLWAEWCAPCRSLGPVLEALAIEREGAFRLAKVDVDRNPAIAQRFQVMSIPAVKAFVDGGVVAEFTGALPQEQVRQWLDPLVPGPGDRRVLEARTMEGSGDLAGAEAAYREALADDPDNPQARLGLAGLLLARGDVAPARELARPLLPDPDAVRVMAAADVRSWAGERGSEPRSAARRAAAAGAWDEALAGLLAVLPDDPSIRDDILTVFAVLGDEDELTHTYRRKLAAALF